MGKSFGLLGFPLEHSFSPRYFKEKFIRLGLADYRYYLVPTETISRELIDRILEQDQELCGFNVTIPHKKTILEVLDELDDSAVQCGSVNTLKINRKGSRTYIKGFNTDTIGFKKSFLPWVEDERFQVLVLGSGGASMAVQHVLQQEGFVFRVVSASFQGQFTYPDLTQEIIENHQVIINTTPLGMFPDVGSSPMIPYEYLHAGHYCFDLIYNPSETLFLKKALEHGARVKNGLEMLFLQAEASFEIWETDSV